MEKIHRKPDGLSWRRHPYHLPIKGLYNELPWEWNVTGVCVCLSVCACARVCCSHRSVGVQWDCAVSHVWGSASSSWPCKVQNTSTLYEFLQHFTMTSCWYTYVVAEHNAWYRVIGFDHTLDQHACVYVKMHMWHVVMSTLFLKSVKSKLTMGHADFNVRLECERFLFLAVQNLLCCYILQISSYHYKHSTSIYKDYSILLFFYLFTYIQLT